MKGYRNVVRVDPNLEDCEDWSEMDGADWVILMTPHTEFADLSAVHETVGNPEAVYCDIWGFWDAMKYESDNGYFRGREFASRSP
jgi:UDP-N-acetyl-D-mannosaminuronic acid dehydrogenase